MKKRVNFAPYKVRWGRISGLFNRRSNEIWHKIYRFIRFCSPWI